MSLTSQAPRNVVAQTGNANNLITWDIMAGAINYIVQRSTDGVTWANVATPSYIQYLDTSVTVGVKYYYQVAAVSSVGTGPYTPCSPNWVIPALPGQVALGTLRYRAKLKADKLHSKFLTEDEWNINLNQSLFELFDLLVSKYGNDYVMATPYTFETTGAKNYPLPDGSATYAVGGVTPMAVNKILGLDCGVSVGNNAWVTLPRFNWIDRNKFVYPQLQANALGVFNLSYRQMGNQIYFIPNPSAGQYIQLWYIPVMQMLLQDTDIMSFSISGWDEYVVIDAAIKALNKEESFDQANMLKQDKQAMLARIEIMAENRDVGQANTVSNTRANTGFYGEGGFGGNGGGQGGW